jgi:hypothetical protein
MPFINDFADIIYKYNIKNITLLKNKLRKRGEKNEEILIVSLRST